ncbi:MAG: CopG family ribbon-helix-helix protein [Stellaceae bacterium]
MAEATFTFRVDDELKARFTEAAKAHDRTGAQLLRDFMRDYVRRREEEAGYDAWFRHQVAAGIASADAGHLTPAEEVEAEFTDRRAATRRKLGDRES